MALTRANVETILVKRVGKLLAAAELDGTTVNGSNPDLSDPIGVAIRKLGYLVDNPAAVTDTDVARVAADEVDELLDRAELRALESIQGNLDQVDITVGPRQESLDQLATRVQKAIDAKRAAIAREYGAGVATLEGGVITLGFQEQN